MGKNEKGIANGLGVLVSELLFIAITTGSVIIGIITKINFMMIPYILSSITIVAIAYNFIGTKIHMDKMISMRGQGFLDMLENAKKNVEENKENIRNMMKKSYVQSIVYITLYRILLYVTYIILCMSFGYLKVYDGSDVIVAVTCVFIAIMIITVQVDMSCFFIARFETWFNRLKGSDVEYPKLKEFIKSIFVEEGINNEIEVLIIGGNMNCGISEEKGKIYISIGTFILKTLTDDEIKTVIYHEIAHFKNKDTEYSSGLQKLKNILFILMPDSLSNILCPIAMKNCINSELWEVLSTLDYENKADDYILSKGLNKEYASAGVKMYGINNSFSKANSYGEYLYCKNDGWTKENLDKYFDVAIEDYNKHIEMWDLISKKHLEERFYTHPNVRQRRDKFYPDELDLHIDVNHSFDDDIWAFYDSVNEYYKKNPTTRDDKRFIDRYESYLEHVKKEYIDSIYDDVNKLNLLLDECMSNGNYEVSEGIAKRILELKGEHDRASYALGIIYACDKLSDECIPYLKSQYENPNNMYAEYAFQNLAEYYIKTGNEEGRLELRKIQVNQFDTSNDFAKVMTLSLNDKLEEYTNNEVIDKVVEICRNSGIILEVSCAKKVYKEYHCIHFILFVNNNNTDEEEALIEKTRKEVFAYLDILDDQFNLNVFYSFSVPKTHKLRKEPLLVYKKR